MSRAFVCQVGFFDFSATPIPDASAEEKTEQLKELYLRRIDERNEEMSGLTTSQNDFLPKLFLSEDLVAQKVDEQRNVELSGNKPKG